MCEESSKIKKSQQNSCFSLGKEQQNGGGLGASKKSVKNKGETVGNV